MTELSIRGEEFLLDGRPTYEGRVFEGKKVQGLLFNVRAVQATFDDGNSETRRYWAYPDTGEWDPDRNLEEFCGALPVWRDHGILAVSVNLQGGGPLYVPEIYGSYENNGFTRAGELKPAYADRLERMLARADELGMVVIVGLFYWVFVNEMENEDAIWRAAHSALNWLAGTGRRNVLVELANEIEVVVKRAGSDLFTYQRQAEMLDTLRKAHPGLPCSTSFIAKLVDPAECTPPDALVEASDYVLIHGNGTRPPELAEKIQALRGMPVFQANPKPILINEDSPAVPNMETSWKNGVSWGYYDQGWAGQGDDPYEWYEPLPRWVDRPFAELSGFQTPPVNWTINTPFKRAFFQRVAEITGAVAAGS